MKAFEKFCRGILACYVLLLLLIRGESLYSMFLFRLNSNRPMRKLLNKLHFIAVQLYDQICSCRVIIH